MERVLAGENIGAGQSMNDSRERRCRRGSSSSPVQGRLRRIASMALEDDFWVTVDHLLHVAVLLLDLQPVG